MDQFYCTTKLSDKKYKTPEGFLVCKDVPICVSGDMDYLPSEIGELCNDAIGFVKVSKRIEDIHASDTIRSFEGKPITLEHPEGSKVTPENYRSVAHGLMHNVRPGSGAMNNSLISDLMITDAKAIELVESGNLREVSVGYLATVCKLDDGSFVHKDIIGNHISLVKNGRAGARCAISDSKKGEPMSFKDKLRDACNMFTKAVEDAAEDKVVDKIETATQDSVPFADSMKAFADRISAIEKAVSDMPGQLKEMMAQSVTTTDAKKEQKKEVVVNDSNTVSMAEVLAPGIDKTTANLKEKALEVFHATQEGKEIVGKILGGASFADSSKELLFNAAVAMVSDKRSTELSKINVNDSKKAVKSNDVKSFNEAYRKKQNQS